VCVCVCVCVCVSVCVCVCVWMCVWMCVGGSNARGVGESRCSWYSVGNLTSFAATHRHVNRSFANHPQMNLNNLALVFGPNILWQAGEKPGDLSEGNHSVTVAAELFFTCKHCNLMCTVSTSPPHTHTHIHIIIHARMLSTRTCTCTRTRARTPTHAPTIFFVVPTPATLSQMRTGSSPLKKESSTLLQHPLTR
jgi:hypothetical protein